MPPVLKEQQILEPVEPAKNRTPVPIQKLISLRNKGYSYDQIGKIVGRAKQTVNERLSPWEDQISGLKDWKEHKHDVIEVVLGELINSLSPDELKSLSTRDKVWCFGVLYDKIQSSQTVNNYFFTQIIQDAHDKDKRKVLEGSTKTIKSLNDKDK